MRTILFLSFVLLFTCQAKAQFVSADIGVNGLTCSQCSRNVEMKLRKLSFVKDVSMNLQHTEGHISFNNENVSPEKISRAVTDAGFSLRFLRLTIPVNSLDKKDMHCFSNGHNTIQLAGNKTLPTDGNVTLQFIDQHFLPQAEYKQWKKKLVKQCNDVTYFATVL